MAQKFIASLILILATTSLSAVLDEELVKNRLQEAKIFTQQKQYDLAIEIYEQLLRDEPNNAEYYLYLGRLYKKLGCFSYAIDLYLEGLRLKPDYEELKVSLAYAYLYRGMHTAKVWSHYRWFWQYPYMFYIVPEDIIYRFNAEDIEQSRLLFEEVLCENPKNSIALTGLGRIEVLYDNIYATEYFYSLALDYEEDDDTTIYYYYATLLSKEGKVYSSKCMYEHVLSLDPTDSQAWEDYNDVLWKIGPKFGGIGFYSQENEQDNITPTKKAWAARLYDYGGTLAWDYAIRDRLSAHISVTDEYIRLKNLLNQTNIYSLLIQRANLGLSYQATPYLSMFGGLGFSLFNQHHSSTFKTRFGWYLQPNFNVTYQQKGHQFFVETSADAPLVARDFNDNRSCLVDRQFLRGYYEYNFGNRNLIGTTAANVWYINRIKKNQQQIASAWLQWGPPCIYEYVVVRYQFIFGRFNHITTDYYTYRFQTTHWLNVTVSKSWWNNQIVTEAGYGHAWQRGFEQGQIITLTPVAPFQIIHREINACYAILEYDPHENIRITLRGTYTKDSFNYTTASATGKFEWKF